MTDPEPTPADPTAAVDRREGEDEGDDDLLDRMRGAGVGVEDPNIVGDPEPGPVDAEVAEDEPPRV
jgi:hypothetical protein